MTDIQKELFSLRDEKYKKFQSSLMPDVAEEKIIGVRTPLLRALAKKTEVHRPFLNNLPHRYYEENNLHAFIIERIENVDVLFEEINAFLPFVDNWATCDSLRPKAFKKNKSRLLFEIDKWLQSPHVYTVRFGIVMLMTHFLDEDFDEAVLEMAAGVKSEEYYVNMATAWFFATALAKKYNETLPYFERACLDKWVHNKAIQKARESFRVTALQKEYLKKLKQ